MRNDRTGLTPGTLPLITFDRCALETRRYKAACASVMTEVCGFGRIMDSLYEEAAKNRRTIREPLVHTPEALRLRSCLVFPPAADADKIMDRAGSNGYGKVFPEEFRDLMVGTAFPS